MFDSKFLQLVLLIFTIVNNAVILNNFRKNQWEKTEFVWNFGIIASLDISTYLLPIQYFQVDNQPINLNLYKDIKSGTTIWIRCCQLMDFYKKVMPTIKNPFILVICDGDESFPSDCFKDIAETELFLSDKNLIHVFAQNCDYCGHNIKVSHLPIGIDFHTIGYKSAGGSWGEKGTPIEQEKVLKNILSGLKPTRLRIKKAFVDFQHSDSMHGNFKRYLQFGEDRRDIFKRLLSTGLIEYSNKFMPRSELWRKKGQYAFSISPHGNGLDCHRTWEDLALGCIVIVKTSLLDPLYKGLPVVIVKDWSEIILPSKVQFFKYSKR